MKKLLAILYLVGLLTPAFSQKESKYLKDSFDVRHVPVLRLALDTAERFEGSSQLPFSQLKFEDVRFDTTQIGFYSEAFDLVFPSIRNHKINLKGGLAKSLGLYFNNFYQQNLSSETGEVVCFVKTLSITRRDTINENQLRNKTLGQIRFQAEAFLKSEGMYYAAFKIDTLLYQNIAVKRKELTDDIKEYLLTPVLQMLKNKVSALDWAYVKKKKAFDESTVRSNYFDNRFNLPILTSTSYKKGIYQTFDEFKNNSPSIEEFTIKTDKPLVFLRDNTGSYINPSTIFGFSDGKHCWIQLLTSSFPLIRTGNSFEFFITFTGNLKVLWGLNMSEGFLF